MKRRTFLQSAAVGGAGLATAGCLGFGDGDSAEIQIDQISVVNSDDTNHTAEVEVLYNGDTVYDDSHELAAQSNDSSDTVNISDDLPSESGSYEITVNLTDTDAETFTSKPAEEYDNDCEVMEIQLLSTGDGVDILKKFDSC
jgi:hypothetical protein